VFDRGGAGYSYRVPLPSPATDSLEDGGSVGVTTARPRRRFTNIESLRGPHHSRSSNLLHRLGAWSSKAVAGVTVACLLAGWGIVGVIAGFPSWWQVALYSTTSAVTVVMVFAIQHTQHREQLVTQRKLDELVRAQPGADDRLIAAEAATDAELDNLIEANDV
jgi:low affinity Fe/Cu permease